MSKLPYLNALGERVEHLATNLNGLQEVLLAALVNDVFARVVPVKVHDRLLQSQQIVDGTVDQVDARCVTWLRTQVVLEI